MDNLSPEALKELRDALRPLSGSEKEEVIYDALYKTIENILMEYELTYGQIVAGLEVVKQEFIARYHEERFGKNEKS